MAVVRNVSQIVMAPVQDHSTKPEEVRERIEQMLPGPYIELFARDQRATWTTWGNEVAGDGDEISANEVLEAAE
jgi:N6-adenosine-specific RNA methylase IME4